MADTYTALLRLLLQEDGGNINLWGNLWNEGVADLVEQALAGVTTIDVTTGSTSLSSANGNTDQSRSMVLYVEGAPGANRQIIVPSTQKLYIVHNNTTGGFTVEIKTSATSGVVIASGQTQIVFVDANANQVVGLGPTGATVDRAGEWTSLQVEILNHTAGDQFVDTEYVNQGDFVMWKWDGFSTTISSTDFGVQVAGGGSFPTVLNQDVGQPFRAEHPTIIKIGGLVVPSYLTWAPGPFPRVDFNNASPGSGGLYTAATTRELVGQPVFTYFNTAPT